MRHASDQLQEIPQGSLLARLKSCQASSYHQIGTKTTLYFEPKLTREELDEVIRAVAQAPTVEQAPSP